MKSSTILFTALLTLFAGFSQFSAAENEAEASDLATLIVYRSDQSIRTQRLDLDMHVGELSFGRLDTEEALVITRPAGEYVLGTSIKGTKETTIQLNPGQTHYVYTDLRLRGTQLKVKLTEVDEQLAFTQQPSLVSPI